MSINNRNYQNVNSLLILLIVLLLPSLIKAKEPDWYIKLKQIKPAESTRADVERIFDSPIAKPIYVDNGLELVHYQTAEGKMSVEYSIGKCTSEKTPGYDLENGIVTNIIFFPEQLIKFSRFKVDRKKLIKTHDGHDPPWHYVNQEASVDYTVGRGLLLHVKFQISLNQDYLKCKDWKPNVL